MAELAGAHVLWDAGGLARWNDEGLGSRDLCDEVREVKRVRVVIINEQDHQRQSL